MSNNEPVLVTGASGQQGGAVLKHLLKEGFTVRALTRSTKKGNALKSLGAEVVTGDFSDRTSLDLALSGVKKVFLMTTFFEAGMEAEVKQGQMVIDAAKTAGVEHLVFSSVANANQKTGIPHFDTKWQVEQYLQKVGLPTTILRPAAFMENFGTYWPPSPEGTFTLPMWPETKLKMIAVDNIGAFAAAAFMRPQDFIEQAIDLAGDALTMPELAAALSESMKRPVQFQQLPDDEAEAAMGSDFARMFRWFNESGYTVDIPGLETKWGIPLTKFKDVIKTAIWAQPAQK